MATRVSLHYGIQGNAHEITFFSSTPDETTLVDYRTEKGVLGADNATLGELRAWLAAGKPMGQDIGGLAVPVTIPAVSDEPRVYDAEPVREDSNAG